MPAIDQRCESYVLSKSKNLIFKRVKSERIVREPKVGKARRMHSHVYTSDVHAHPTTVTTRSGVRHFNAAVALAQRLCVIRNSRHVVEFQKELLPQFFSIELVYCQLLCLLLLPVRNALRLPLLVPLRNVLMNVAVLRKVRVDFLPLRVAEAREMFAGGRVCVRARGGGGRR